MKDYNKDIYITAEKARELTNSEELFDKRVENYLHKLQDKIFESINMGNYSTTFSDLNEYDKFSDSTKFGKVIALFLKEKGFIITEGHSRLWIGWNK